MLALHQPVAVDLRRIAAALKINTDLERMADLAEDIAERALALAQLPPIPIPDKLQRMTDLTTSMVRQSLDAFVNLDATLARRVCRLDDEVDRYNNEIIEELIRLMQTSPEHGRAGPVAVLGDAPPGAHRRPRHQHRRGRGLPGGGRDRPPSSGSRRGGRL